MSDLIERAREAAQARGALSGLWSGVPEAKPIKEALGECGLASVRVLLMDLYDAGGATRGDLLLLLKELGDA